MTDKRIIDSFISKYHLGGNIERVKWVSDSESLSAKFINDSQNLVGKVVSKNFKFPIGEFGIYSTSTLSKMLGILENEVGKKTALDKSKLHETVKQGFVSYYKAGLESQICKKNPTFLRGLKKIIKQYFPYVMLIRASLMIRNQKPEYYDDFYKVMNFLRKE